MGVFDRIAKSVSGPVHRLLDRLEDPAETYELARTRQKEMLAEVRAQLAEDEAERRDIEAKLPPGRRGEPGGPAARHRILVREEAKLRELEARLESRITEFGTLIESTNAARAGRGSGSGSGSGSAGGTGADFGDDAEIRATAAQVEAEMRRLEEELRRNRG